MYAYNQCCQSLDIERETRGRQDIIKGRNKKKGRERERKG
jgi:hypothetical protein